MAAPAINPDSLSTLETEFDKLRKFTHDTALEAQLITPEDDAWLHQIGIQSYTPHQEGNNQRLETAAIGMAERTQDPAKLQGVLNLTNLMAADRIVMNALTSAYRASVTPPPEEQFKEFFEKGLKDPKKQAAFIKALEAARDQMIISIDQTMHPTIYHTKFAREIETALTERIEALADDMITNRAGSRNPDLRTDTQQAIEVLIAQINGGEKLTYDRRVTLSEENQLDHDSHIAMKENFGEVIEAYNTALVETVNALERSGDLNPALANKVRGYIIDTEERDPLQWRTWAFGADADGRPKSTAPALWQYIYYQVEHGKYISRLRDARDNADDHMNAVSCLVQRILLLDREKFGTEQDKDYARFNDFCKKFTEELREPDSEDKPWIKHEQRRGWDGPEHSLLQQLAPTEQAEFLRRIVAGEYGDGDDALKKDFQFLPPEIRKETIAFNQMFADKYREFLTTEGRENRLRDELGIEIETIQDPNGNGTKLLLPEVDALKLPDGTPSPLLNELCAFILKQTVDIDGQKIHFKLDPDDLTGERFPAGRAIVDSRLFYNTEGLKVGENPGEYSTVELSHTARSKLLEVIKRTYVLDHANRKFDGAVCNRHQISEFSGPQDFYAAMLLFKEAGIIEIENGLVKGTPSICIQPLFETSEDQEHAADTFRTLLADPMVRSYYIALANAGIMPQVMFGCSDGAKSAGNLSSEWSNYIYTRAIQEEFRKACANPEYVDEFKGLDLRLRVFYGRGHGDSRGGHMAEGQNQRMMSPEMAEGMIYDCTIQSEEHLQMMMDKKFGLDTCASILEGTVTSKCEAELEKEKRTDAKYSNWVKGMEKVIGKIADESKDGFCKYVLERPETMIFIDSIHDNPYKSSRPAKRTGDAEEQNDPDALRVRMGLSAKGGTIKAKSADRIKKEAEEKLKNTRAITVEYAFQAMADFPVHYLGMREALQKFVAENRPIDMPGSIEPATKHFGLNGLQYLYEAHPFFRNMVDKTKVALKDYDPDVFRQYAKIAGVSGWADECITELDGHGGAEKSLLELLDIISRDTPALETGEGIRATITARGNDPQQAGFGARSRNLLRGPATILDKLAHIIPFSFAVDRRAEPPATNSRWSLGINPLKPDRDSDSVDDKLKVRIMDNCSFTAQEIHPQNLKFAHERVLEDVVMARQTAGRA